MSPPGRRAGAAPTGCGQNPRRARAKSMSCESKRDRLRDSSSLRHGQNPLSTRAARSSRIPASVNSVIGSSHENGTPGMNV